MKTYEQLEKRIAELEFTNERLRLANKNQTETIEFILSNKPLWYKLFV